MGCVHDNALDGPEPQLDEHCSARCVGQVWPLPAGGHQLQIRVGQWTRDSARKCGVRTSELPLASQVRSVDIEGA